MRFPTAVLGLSLLAACAPSNTWSSRVEDPGLPPFLPEHLLRKPADFRLYDAPVRKEFFLYFYADEEVQEDIVAVIDYAAPEGQRRPRFATREEHAYALDIFQADWRSRGDQEKLKYFNERHAIDTRRKESLIDQKIDFKKREIQHLADKVYDIESDLASRKDTNTFGPGNEKLTLSPEGALAPIPALEAELARTRRKLAVAETQLFVLEYRRSMRDLADARGSGDFVEGRVGIADLLPDDAKNEEFINLVVRKVSPAAWQRPEARIGISRGDLVVIQTRDVIVQVRDYVNQLRHEARAKLRSSTK